jgi:hypothetical protein
MPMVVPPLRRSTVPAPWQRWLRDTLGPLSGRGRWAALGLFALVAIGLHAGADRLDDRVFVLLNLLDGALDALFTAVIRGVGGRLGLEPGRVERGVVAAIEWIDLDAKVKEARRVAILVELASTLALGLPLLFLRGGSPPLGGDRAALRRALRDPTLLRLGLPIAVGLATLAGSFTLGREVFVAVHDALLRLSLPDAIASGLARALGVLVLSGALWFLGARGVAGAVRLADARGERDLSRLVPTRRRRLRGLFVAGCALPVAALAVLEGTPIFETLGALLVS